MGHWLEARVSSRASSALQSLLQLAPQTARRLRGDNDEHYEVLLRLLERFDAVQAIMLPTLGEERRATYSPFLPISPITGHVLQVPTLERNVEKGTIVFDDPAGGRTDCADTVLAGVTPGEECYFIHSYEAKPADEADRLADTVYGGRAVCAAAAHGSVVGCQFHPEKSGKVGLKIIEEYMKRAEK